jgi:hypothetical protein
MSSKNATLAGIAVFIVFVLLIASVASKESTPSTLVGLSSTSNTSVKLYFSKPLSDSAGDPAAYKIFRPQSCDENNWHAELRVISAELSQDAKVVTLTTAAQSATRYQLVISGLSDKGGNLALPPEQDAITQFVGTTASQAVDTDGDGITDAEEQYGWAVWTTTASGISMCRDVNSDPDKKDTDGDGVEDGFEASYATDPRSRDTDEDNLYDYAESFEYFSSPLTTDTDQDGISDGVEALLLNTSPVLSDTDGDGVDDSQEISSGGTDPRLADLPELRLDLHGNPSIILNMTISGETGITTVESTLQQDREEQVDMDNSATKMSIENTVQLHTEVKVGTSHWPPSANAKLTTDTKFKHGYFHETSSNWTDSSVAESKKAFEEKTLEKTVISYDDGMLWAAMKVTNNSNLTFKVKDLRVIAYRMLPNGSFSVVGTLTPGEKSSTVISADPEIKKDIWVSQTLCADPADPSTCGHILGPGGEIVLVMGADSLPAQEMKALVTDPSALMFEIGSYSLYQLDEWGVTETVNFAKLGESVIQRTGILVIDYGDGRVERFMVATNVRRNLDGSGTGISLEEALKEIIGISDYEICEDQQTLCRLKDISEFRCVYETSESEGMPDFCSPSPALSIANTADPITYDNIDQVIQYSYNVTNTGNVKIREPITVSDDKADDESCPVISSTGNCDEYLDPGESIVCTASYSITHSDLEAGAVTNVAYATGSDASDQLVTSPQDSETVFLGTLVDTETISASQTSDQAISDTDSPTIPNGFWIVAGTSDQFDVDSKPEDDISNLDPTFRTLSGQ